MLKQRSRFAHAASPILHAKQKWFLQGHPVVERVWNSDFLPSPLRHRWLKRHQGLSSVELLIFWGYLRHPGRLNDSWPSRVAQKESRWYQPTKRAILFPAAMHSHQQWKGRDYGLNFCPVLYCSMCPPFSLYTLPGLLQAHQDQNSSGPPSENFSDSSSCAWHVQARGFVSNYMVLLEHLGKTGVPSVCAYLWHLNGE